MQPGEQTSHPASGQSQTINSKAILLHDGPLAAASVCKLLGMQNSALSVVARLLHHAEHTPESLSALSSYYHCVTQRRVEDNANGYTKARVGYDEYSNVAGRWKYGSVLRYNIDKDSFKNQDLADFTEKEMVKAISMWRNVGVEFEQAGSDQEVTFQIQYRCHWNRAVYAESFFPGTEHGILYVYGGALDESNIAHLAKILAHEIGHILGLRHEFAGVMESGLPSMLWGKPSPKSVMGYYGAAANWSGVQEQDIQELKDFYELQEGFEMVDGVRKMTVCSFIPGSFRF